MSSETNATILVVEDNAANQELVTDLLEAQGYRVIVSPDAEAAIELLRELSPDLVLMDIRLPGIDGLQATRKILDMPGPHPPIVALTAHAMKGDRERVLAAGCSGYLTKPLDTRAFTQTVREIMRNAGGPAS